MLARLPCCLQTICHGSRKKDGGHEKLTCRTETDTACVPTVLNPQPQTTKPFAEATTVTRRLPRTQPTGNSFLTGILRMNPWHSK